MKIKNKIRLYFYIVFSSFVILSLLYLFKPIISTWFVPPEERLNYICRGNLQAIYQALRLYQDKYSYYPESLEALSSEDYINEDKLSCPFLSVHTFLGIKYYKKHSGIDYIYQYPPGIVDEFDYAMVSQKTLVTELKSNHSAAPNFPVNTLYINGKIEND